MAMALAFANRKLAEDELVQSGLGEAEVPLSGHPRLHAASQARASYDRSAGRGLPGRQKKAFAF